MALREGTERRERGRQTETKPETEKEEKEWIFDRPDPGLDESCANTDKNITFLSLFLA